MSDITEDVTAELAKLGLIYEIPSAEFWKGVIHVTTPEGFGTFTIEPDYLTCVLWGVENGRVKQIGGADVDLTTVKGAEAIATLITQIVRWPAP